MNKLTDEEIKLIATGNTFREHDVEIHKAKLFDKLCEIIRTKETVSFVRAGSFIWYKVDGGNDSQEFSNPEEAIIDLTNPKDEDVDNNKEMSEKMKKLCEFKIDNCSHRENVCYALASNGYPNYIVERHNMHTDETDYYIVVLTKESDDVGEVK